MTVLLLLAAGCGGDDDSGGDTSAQSTATNTATTDTATTTSDTTQAQGEEPPFSPTYTFSGDELLKCLKGKGQTAKRESEPPADDKVGQGIVHDRVLVGDGPALRVFMFGAADLAAEQGKAVKQRTANARILGTVILEPLEGDAKAESGAAIACLTEQAPAG